MSPIGPRPRIALATYERAPRLAPDDALIPPALADVGVDAEPVVWSDGRARWDEYDGVLIRSCWDYHLRLGEFRAWLDRLDAAGVVAMNSTTLVRWNADKQYLLDLARHGVPTIPTVIVPQGEAASVDAVAGARGWTRFVLKPTVSASGHETHAFHSPLDASARTAVERVLSRGDALLQPFADEVAEYGELSFTFIDGAPSHATLKRAAPGEFRVQHEHGGSAEPIDPPGALVEQAGCVLEALSEPPLYARVDGIVVDDRFVLMELELIEPNLFLGFGAGSAARLASGVARRLKGA